jgi:hypothetical protein
MTPNQIRKASNKVRVEKKEDAVAGCQLITELTIPDTGEGVIELQGRNFYYGDATEHARFRTVEAGGNTFLVKSRGKKELSGAIYRCVR